MAEEIPWGWLLKMAWRDGRSGLNRLSLFMASIVLGIAGLVAIQNFGLTLEDTISGQSQELMGADYQVDTNKSPSQALLDSLQYLPGTLAKEVNLATMIAFPNREGTRLVRLRGIDAGYPFYGQLKTNPPVASENYIQWGGALLDPALMTQYDLKPGDFINLGNLSLPVAGSLELAPGNSGAVTSVAPVVWIPYDLVQETGLIQPGSRIGYNFYFQVPSDTDLNTIHENWDEFVNRNEADIDLHTETGQRLGRRFDNVGQFLKLVAFIALLLGCLGIASSVNIYMREKRQFIAILKCLGTSKRDSFLIFLIQIGSIGLLGGILGTFFGLLAQQAFPLVVQDFLPLEITWNIYWGPVVLGLFLGFIMAVLFGLTPLLNTLLISPLAALRIGDAPSRLSGKWKGILVLILFLVLWGVSAGLLDNALGAFAFLLGLTTTLAVLAILALSIMWGIRNFFPNSWSFEWRQSLLNLFRPNNQTLVLVLAIGIGSFLISILYFTQDLLLAQANLEDQRPTANLILLDVQSEQQKEVSKTLRDNAFPVMDNIPIVTMRLAAIKDRSVQDLRNDSISTINRWILSHEFRVTYRDSLIASETLKEGEWFATYSGDSPVPISLSDNVARDAQVTIGDRLLFNVQGVLMETVVANVREVDWGRLQLNFSVVFPEGVLEQAPKFHVITTQVPNAEASAKLQQILVRAFPNITVLDIRQLLDVASGILEKIGWIIQFMALLSILTGFIILIGAVRNSKFQRIRENVILRTLGAKGNQIRKIAMNEYLLLGALGSSIGVILALVATYLLAHFLFETPFTPSWIPFLVLIPLICLVVVVLGIGNSRAVIKSPPLEVLRRDSV